MKQVIITTVATTVPFKAAVGEQVNIDIMSCAVDAWINRKVPLADVEFILAVQALIDTYLVDRSSKHGDEPSPWPGRFAENVARLVATQLGVDWQEFESLVEDVKRFTESRAAAQSGK